MGFLTGLFGGETNIWTILLALIVVVALIFLFVWIQKLISKASATIAGGRKRRLAMVASLAIDNKRNVILIRRDDVEHLIMVSNTGELLIEGSIPIPDADSEIKARSSTSVEQKPPALENKKSTPIAGGIAAGSLAAGGVAAMAVSGQNNNANANAQNTSDKNVIADRLGLSRLLRKSEPPKNQLTEPAPIPAPTKSPQPQIDATPLVPVAATSASASSIVSAALKSNLSVDQTSKTAPIFNNNTITPLRTSGILKPISEMTGVSGNTSSDSKKAKNNNEIKNAPIKNSPIENSPLEESHVENSPLDESSIDIIPVQDSTGKINESSSDENLKSTAPKETNDSKETNEAKSLGSDELNSAQTSTKPAPETNDQEKTEEVRSDREDNSKANPTDSAKNEVQQIDAKAMESIEEGTNSDNEGAKSGKKASDSGSKASDGGSAKEAKANEKTS